MYQQHRMPRRENLPGERGSCGDWGLSEKEQYSSQVMMTARKKDTRMAKETGHLTKRAAHRVGKANGPGIQRVLLSS